MQPCSRQEPPLFAQEYPLWIKFTLSSVKKLKSQIRIHEGRISDIKKFRSWDLRQTYEWVQRRNSNTFLDSSHFLQHFQYYVILISVKSAVQISTQLTRCKKKWLWEECFHSWRNNRLPMPNTAERALAHARTLSWARVTTSMFQYIDFRFHRN